MPLELLMPMGGKGVRFEEGGVSTPKPLIMLHGRPFFWWAAQSVLRGMRVDRMVCVVLRAHEESHGITAAIRQYYPDAHFVYLDEVLDGPVLTCERGMEAISDGAGVIVNDCDHLFLSREYDAFAADEAARAATDGGLLTFKSDNPAFSYVKLDANGNVTGTAEKQVVSGRAICGAYYFKDKAVFASVLDGYKQNCPYDELFISGLYDELARAGRSVRCFAADAHLPFGTPAEYESAQNSPLFEEFLP